MGVFRDSAEENAVRILEYTLLCACVPSIDTFSELCGVAKASGIMRA